MKAPAEILRPGVAAPEGRRLLSEGAVYLAATVCAQGLNFAWVLAAARLLGPSGMGVWNAFAVVLAYVGVLELGVINAVYREIPRARGAGSADQVAHLRALSLGMAALSGAVSAALVIGFGIAMAPGLRAAVAVLGLLVAAREIYLVVSTLARADRDFALAGKAAVLRVAVWCAGLPWVARGGLVALLAWVLAGDLAAALLLARGRGYRLRPRPFRDTLRASPQDRPNGRLEARALLGLAGIGWPMLVSSTVGTMMSTVDRMIVIALLGRAALGYYSLAIIALSLLMVAPPVADQVLFPAMSERLGATGRVESLRRYFETPTLALAYSAPPLMAGVALALPLLVGHLLPAYARGLPAANVMVIGGFFLAVGTVATKLLMAINRQRLQLAAQCGAVGAQVALAWILASRGLVGIAAAAAIAYGLYALAAVGLSLKFLGYGAKAAARLGALIALPLAAYLAFDLARPAAASPAGCLGLLAIFGVGYAAWLAAMAAVLPSLRALALDLRAGLRPPG